jgi:hypothetical protein
MKKAVREYVKWIFDFPGDLLFSIWRRIRFQPLWRWPDRIITTTIYFLLVQAGWLISTVDCVIHAATISFGVAVGMMERPPAKTKSPKPNP